MLSNANPACSLKVFVELLEASGILIAVTQTGRVRIYQRKTFYFLTVELTAPAPSREATHGVILQYEVLTCGEIVLRQYSVGVDSKQREEGKGWEYWIDRNYKNRRTLNEYKEGGCKIVESE